MANSIALTAPARSLLSPTEASAASSRKTPALKPYFVNLPVDFLFIGGASILTYLLIRYLHGGARTSTITSLGIWLSWVVNWPHFSATSYRLYSAREHLRQYPVTAIVAPILAGVGALGSFAYPLVIAPYFIKIFLLWSPYHFSGQSIGISLLYARRAEHKVDAASRFTLSAFIYGTFLISSLRAETSVVGSVYYGVSYPGFGIPEWIPTVASYWTYGCGAIFLLLLVRQCVMFRRLPPLMFLLPAGAQFVWFVMGSTLPGFTEFVPLFHSLQYLLIAWAMQLKEKADRQGRAGTPRYVAVETVRWYALNVLGGVALFWGLPEAATRLGVSSSTATGVLLAAVQIHHFFVDGVIWKLKARSVVSPLLVNVPQMMKAASAPRSVPEAA
jgi:hypothetical protein